MFDDGMMTPMMEIVFDVFSLSDVLYYVAVAKRAVYCKLQRILHDNQSDAAMDLVVEL